MAAGAPPAAASAPDGAGGDGRVVEVEVVVVGDELLLGDVADTNTAMLGRLFAAAGVRLTRSTCVGDDLDDLRGVLSEAVRRRPAAVVVAGGLGPTSDDRTRSAVAALAGVPLHRDPVLERELAGWYAGRGRQLPDLARQQADLPVGARPVPNRTGSAAGFALAVDGVVLYCLPGVPAELSQMAGDEVLGELAAPGAGLLLHALHVVGLGESDVAARLAPLERSLPAGVRLAYLASPGGVSVRLSGWGPAQAGLTAAVDRAQELLGDAVAARDRETLAEVVHRLLRAGGATCATAESLTGGALGAALTDVPGASATYRGGVVSYATAAKARVLGVDADLLRTAGAVHPDVAAQLALGVRTLLEATYGVATTGVAGPDGQDGRPVGTVHLAVAGPAGVSVATHLLPGSRDLVRAASVTAALDLLRRVVLQQEASAGKKGQ